MIEYFCHDCGRKMEAISPNCPDCGCNYVKMVDPVFKVAETDHVTTENHYSPKFGWVKVDINHTAIEKLATQKKKELAEKHNPAKMAPAVYPKVKPYGLTPEEYRETQTPYYEYDFCPRYVERWLLDNGYPGHWAAKNALPIFAKALPVVYTAYDKKLDVLRAAAGNN